MRRRHFIRKIIRGVTEVGSFLAVFVYQLPRHLEMDEEAYALGQIDYYRFTTTGNA